MNIHQNCWSGQTLLLPPYILTMTWSLFVPGVAADDSKPHPPDSLMHPTIVKTPNNIQRDMRTGYIKHIRCTYTQKRDQREYWTLPCICSHFVTNISIIHSTTQLLYNITSQTHQWPPPILFLLLIIVFIVVH